MKNLVVKNLSVADYVPSMGSNYEITDYDNNCGEYVHIVSDEKFEKIKEIDVNGVVKLSNLYLADYIPPMDGDVEEMVFVDEKENKYFINVVRNTETGDIVKLEVGEIS